MDELARQWYQVGSLFIQAGFLVAGVLSIRAILRSNRTSQEQMGALLRLTVCGAHSEENARLVTRPTPYLLDGWPEAAPHGNAESMSEKTPTPARRGSVFAGVIGWLQQPMSNSNVGAWRRTIRWLQAPAGS